MKGVIEALGDADVLQESHTRHNSRHLILQSQLIISYRSIRTTLAFPPSLNFLEIFEKETRNQTFSLQIHGLRVYRYRSGGMIWSKLFKVYDNGIDRSGCRAAPTTLLSAQKVTRQSKTGYWTIIAAVAKQNLALLD
jgi:hypothetical protein